MLYYLLLCLLGLTSFTSVNAVSCQDRIQIAQESGKVVVDFKYYPMKDIKSSQLIRCAPAGMRNPYYFANECQLKMGNCGGFVISKIGEEKPQVCYFKSKYPNDLIKPSESWDTSYTKGCLGTYLNNQ